MVKGLRGSKSSLKMIPTYVERPSGNEKGKFIALDLGGTNFRVLELELKGKRKIKKPVVATFALKRKHMRGTGKALFDFIAGSIKTFMRRYNLDTRERFDVGFTFSFPVKQRGIAEGVLIRWTKGFRASGVEGKNVVELLNDSLKRKGIKNSKVIALANDTVGTLVARSYKDPNCDVGVILGTGTNACYCENVSNIARSKGKKTRSGKMVINIEWGNFNKVCRTQYDKKLDRISHNTGEQILEKMVSGMYLGEITRLILKDLARRKYILGKTNQLVLNKRGIIKTEYMSSIEGDRSKNLSKTKRVLKKIGILNSKYEDRKLIKKVCSVISRRAARVSAAAMAATVTKIDPTLSKRHTIAIDGSVYEKYPGFSKKIKATLNECFKKKSRNIKLTLAKDGSGKGAAIIAAVSRYAAG